MHIEEMEQYKVACHISRLDLRLYGITVDDIVNRTPLAHLFFTKASELAKNSTDYQWPGCAMSMQMEFYSDDIVLIFSERIDDYLYNLKQAALTLPEEQAGSLQRMISVIGMSDEEEARELVRKFEKNVREVQ